MILVNLFVLSLLLGFGLLYLFHKYTMTMSIIVIGLLASTLVFEVSLAICVKILHIEILPFAV